MAYAFENLRLKMIKYEQWPRIFRYKLSGPMLEYLSQFITDKYSNVHYIQVAHRSLLIKMIELNYALPSTLKMIALLDKNIIQLLLHSSMTENEYFKMFEDPAQKSIIKNSLRLSLSPLKSVF